MNDMQVAALSAAASLIHKTGLQKSGSRWITDTDESFYPRTINWLVDRGYLQLYVNKTCAHITSAGEAALERWRDQHRRKTRNDKEPV